MKIELPEVEGYEWVEVSKGEYYAYEGDRATLMFSPPIPFKHFIQRPAKKLYDWSKTHGDVWVFDKLFRRNLARSVRLPAALVAVQWQAHTSCGCPIDPEATIVEVRFVNDHCWRGVASDFNWLSKDMEWRIIHFRVIGLVEGYSYE